MKPKPQPCIGGSKDLAFWFPGLDLGRLPINRLGGFLGHRGEGRPPFLGLMAQFTVFKLVVFISKFVVYNRRVII